VVLVVPYGSGKSRKTDVILKGALVLRETKVMTVVTQPLTSLMNEKMTNPIAGAAEELTVSADTEDGMKAVQSRIYLLESTSYLSVIPSRWALPWGSTFCRNCNA
jgi:hypothetical protein